MPAEYASLLPSSATGWEQAVEQASGERWADLDVDVIRRFKDPYRCPEHLLHFLAYERSVDIWDEAWSIERKRWVIANWPRLERQKGTLAGLRDFVALRDARLVRTIVPPAKTFLNRAITPDERRAYLARFPQLRTYPYVARGKARFGSFGGKAFGLRKAYLGVIYPSDLATRDRYRREVRLFEPRDGSETVLTAKTIRRTQYDGAAVEYQAIALPGRRDGRIFLGARLAGRRFFGPKAVPDRIVSVAVQRDAGHAIGQAVEATVKPGLDPVDVRPELVAVRGARRRGQVFPGAGSHVGAAHVLGSSAWQRIYERITLFDPSRSPDRRNGGRTYLGITRLGMPPHTAEARVAIRGKRSSRAVGRFVTGYLISGDRKPLIDTIDAIAVSKRLSDRILLDTTTRRPLTAGDPIVPGVTRIGGIVAA